VPEFESGSPAARLAMLGITLPEITVPLAAYVPAERTGAYVYASGQLPWWTGPFWPPARPEPPSPPQKPGPARGPVQLVCQGWSSGPCCGTGFGQVGGDAVGAVLGDIHAGRDVAQPRARVVGDAQPHPGVAGQETRSSPPLKAYHNF
jgi:hypothetical protein